MTSADVTLRELILSGSRDATTGHRIYTFEESTIKAIGVPRGARYSLQNIGFFASEDRMYLAAAPADEGDQFLQNSRYYEIKTKQKWDYLDSHLCYEYQCSELKMWEAVLEEATWGTSPDDPRYRTKDYLDGITDSAKGVRDASLTKNDNSTLASWASIFKNPLYPMQLEYRAPSAPVQGLYVIGQPTTTARVDCDQTVYGYEEAVPVFIDTVDSNDCGGDQLLWKMEKELRYVWETYPTGSYREPASRKANLIDLGSERLYEVETTLIYVRDNT